MKKIIMLLIATLAFSFSPAMGSEKNVLKVLEKIRGGVKAGISYKEYCDLVADARVEIRFYMKRGETNRCFVQAAEGCYKWYHLAKDSWGEKIETELQICRFDWSHSPAELKRMKKLLNEMEKLKSNSWRHAQSELDKAYKCLK